MSGYDRLWPVIFWNWNLIKTWKLKKKFIIRICIFKVFYLSDFLRMHYNITALIFWSEIRLINYELKRRHSFIVRLSSIFLLLFIFAHEIFAERFCKNIFIVFLIRILQTFLHSMQNASLMSFLWVSIEPFFETNFSKLAFKYLVCLKIASVMAVGILFNKWGWKPISRFKRAFVNMTSTLFSWQYFRKEANLEVYSNTMLYALISPVF